jgi:hypothetical protein
MTINTFFSRGGKLIGNDEITKNTAEKCIGPNWPPRR